MKPSINHPWRKPTHEPIVSEEEAMRQKVRRQELRTAYNHGADAKLNNQSRDRNPYSDPGMKAEWDRGYSEANI